MLTFIHRLLYLLERFSAAAQWLRTCLLHSRKICNSSLVGTLDVHTGIDLSMHEVPASLYLRSMENESADTVSPDAHVSVSKQTAPMIRDTLHPSYGLATDAETESMYSSLFFFNFLIGAWI